MTPGMSANPVVLSDEEALRSYLDELASWCQGVWSRAGVIKPWLPEPIKRLVRDGVWAGDGTSSGADNRTRIVSFWVGITPWLISGQSEYRMPPLPTQPALLTRLIEALEAEAGRTARIGRRAQAFAEVVQAVRTAASFARSIPIETARPEGSDDEGAGGTSVQLELEASGVRVRYTDDDHILSILDVELGNGSTTLPGDADELRLEVERLRRENEVLREQVAHERAEREHAQKRALLSESIAAERLARIESLKSPMAEMGVGEP